MQNLRQATILAMVLTIALAATIHSAAAATPTQLQNSQVTRTIYIEPSYQVYVDEVSATSPAEYYNITFILPTAGVVFEARAYGPQNQSLAVAKVPQTTNNTYNGNTTITVHTSGLSSFRLVTIIQGMTYNFGNYTTLINFFPVLDDGGEASTTIYLPRGSALVSYGLTSLSNSSQGDRAMVFGTMSLEPLQSTYGTVTFSCNYSTVVAISLQRSIRILSTSVEFSETMTLANAATTPISTVTLPLPSGASGIAARDTIGALTSSTSGGTVTVSLRANVKHSEQVQITLTYNLPLSIIKSVGSRSVLSGDVLPEFLNMPCDSASVTVVMPTWSSDAQIVGGQVYQRYHGPVATAHFEKLTPYTNQAFDASYIPPSLSTQTLSVIAALALVVIIIVAVLLKRRFFPAAVGSKSTAQASEPPKGTPKGK